MSLQGRSVAVERIALSCSPLSRMRLSVSILDAAAGAGVFAAALTTYVLTAPRSIASSDSAELTAAAASLGIPHPPGYPLYVLVGRLFAAVPAGDMGFRLNLMSGVFGALAALAVYAIVLELTRHRISAAVAALSLAFSYHFWGQSLVAEVYTLDAALLGGLIYALCVWERTRRPGALYAAFFLLGLALAHRTTSLFLVPPLIVWGLATGVYREPVPWLRALAWMAPGLGLYLVLPILYVTNLGYIWNVGYDLSGDPTYVDLTTFEGLKWYVTAEVFRPLAFAFGPGDAAREAVRFAGWLWGEFAGAGAILGVVGAAIAYRRRRGFFYLTAGAFVLQAWFFINYRAVDKDQMFLATYLIWAVWVGLGVRQLLDLVGEGHAPSLAKPAARVLALALPVALFALNFSSLQFPDAATVREDADQLFAEVPAETLVIGSWSDIAVLEYFQTVEDRRPDIALIGQWSLTEGRLRELIRTNIGERPVYLLQDVPALRRDFRFVEAGSWYRLEPRTEQGGS